MRDDLGEGVRRQLPSGDARWSSLAGPSVLGRSVLLASGVDVPPPWRNCPRVLLSDVSLKDEATLQRVRHAYLARVPLVYEVEGHTQKPSPGVDQRDPWQVAPNGDFTSEAIWRLATMNSIDARDPVNPVWPHTAAAIKFGATVVSSGGDVMLPNGSRVWCDGGPVTLWDREVPELDRLSVVPRTSIAKGHLMATRAARIDAELAPDQLAAVSDPLTRARIIAPAGSGKTRVLTERARHLVRSGVPVQSLLLLAYNNRAQREMRNRTSDLPELQVQTLNAVSLSIINGRNGFLERAERRTTIDERAVRSILQQLHDFRRVRDSDPVADWIAALAEVRLGLKSPVKVEASYGGDLEGFAELFPMYRQYLADHGLVDFDEQIYRAIEVLLREWPVRFYAEKNAEFLLVDEFQDFRPADMLLLRLLAGPALSVFAVGDDDQTIYGYSGATPEWLVGFERYVPDARHHALTVNYRCPVPVVTAASNLVSHNELRVAKVIRPGPKNMTDIATLTVCREEAPATFTVQRIVEMVADGVEPTDIAVLSRVKVLLVPLALALSEQGVPVTLREAETLMANSGVASTLAWLRVGLDPQNLSNSDVAAVAKRPNRGMSPAVLKMVEEKTSVAELAQLAKRLTGEASTQISGLVRDIEGLARHVASGSSTSVITFVLEQVGLDRSLIKLDQSREDKGKESTFDAMRALTALGRLHPDPSTFESWLKQSLSQFREAKGVELSTVHRVKGQEWPHVIVYDVTQGVFPHRLSDDTEEERRVFHVAITRCIQSLTIVADSSEPSEFLAELSRAHPPRSKRGATQVSTRRPVSKAGPKTVSKASSKTGAKAGPKATPKVGATSSRNPYTALPRRPKADPRSTGLSQRPPSLTRRKPAEESIHAVVGMRFRWSGYDCVVSAVNERGVEVSFGPTRLTVTFGELVHVRGRLLRLAP